MSQSIRAGKFGRASPDTAHDDDDDDEPPYEMKKSFPPWPFPTKKIERKRYDTVDGGEEFIQTKKMVDNDDVFTHPSTQKNVDTSLILHRSKRKLPVLKNKNLPDGTDAVKKEKKREVTDVNQEIKNVKAKKLDCFQFAKSGEDLGFVQCLFSILVREGIYNLGEDNVQSIFSWKFPDASSEVEDRVSNFIQQLCDQSKSIVLIHPRDRKDLVPMNYTITFELVVNGHKIKLEATKTGSYTVGIIVSGCVFIAYYGKDLVSFMYVVSTLKYMKGGPHHILEAYKVYASINKTLQPPGSLAIGAAGGTATDNPSTAVPDDNNV